MEKKIQYRQELKYVCNQRELVIVENKLKAICKRDKFADEQGRYNIRSVYFDTVDDCFFRENEAGVDDRKKYRIRIYNYSDAMIKLECKYALRGKKRKESCSITREQCEALLQGNYNIEVKERQELLLRFLGEGKSKLYVPKVIVDYQRTAFVFPIGNVRITLDRHISSSSDVLSFFEEHIPKRLVMAQDKHILEVKYDELLPDFFWQIVGKGRLPQRSSFSKYYMCRKMSIR